MRINKFILALIFISFGMNTVFADNTSPVVTSRKQSVEQSVDQQKIQTPQNKNKFKNLYQRM